MYISQIKKMSLLVLLVTTLSVSGQVTLDNKATQKVDLGFGVEQAAILSTVAATTISGEELQQTPAISLADALYGRLLGLTALQNGGFVGDEDRGASLNIRGYQTFGEKGILILVDGYERPIDRLSVEEIESVTVLKDAAAVAILGHEGINGAIMVKTKRGRTGETHVKAGYSHKFTFGQEFAEMLNGYDYSLALNKALINDGFDPQYNKAEIELFKSGNDPFFYPNVDWKEIAFRNKGSENRANLSVFGGNEKVQYYTMMDYTDSHGLLRDTKQSLFDSQLRYSKVNIRSNLDFELSPTTKISVNVLGIFQETSQPNDVDANGAVWYIYKTPGSAFPYKTSTGIWGGNEIFGNGNVAAKIQGSGFVKTHQRQLWADAKLTQDLDFWIEGLSTSLRAGYDNASITYESRGMGYMYGYEYYTSKEAIGNKIMVNQYTAGNRETKLGFDQWVDRQWRIANADVGLHYKTSFKESDNFAASFIFNTKGETRDERGNTFFRINWMGYFHYDLQGKYIADLVLAANGSNRSYPAKWAFSPTLSLGYIYANNAESGLFNYGKVRVSGAVQHTDYVPEAGIWLSKWNGNNGAFMLGTSGGSEQWGAAQTSFSTSDFRQETATKFNAGTDIRLLNAVDVTIDAFYQKRSHILIPASEKDTWIAGKQSAYSDVGEVSSYGVELGGKYAKKLGQDFYLNVSGMVTWGRNKIDNYIETPVYSNLSTIGKRVNEAWGLQANGFFKNEADISSNPRQEFSQVRAGDVKYKDTNGDGVINAFDRVAMAYGLDMPEFNYAFAVGAEYKGIGINALFQGTGNYMKNMMWVDGVWGVISDNRSLSREYYANSWDVAGDAALYPRFSSQANPNNEQESSVWLKEISFLKLRTCELYYKLPARLIQKVYLSNAKLFIQGQNLLSFDNVAAMDAEILSTAYPALKAVNIGLSLTF